MPDDAVCNGVALLGFDVPETVAEGEKLRVIAAVECRDSVVASRLVALVVRDQGPEAARVCSVRKYLPSDGTGVAIGLEVDFETAGEHELHVMVCAVGESGQIEEVLFETTRCCNKSAPVRGHLPRLQYNEQESLVLCGVDVPEAVDAGKMRAIVALKRTWHDAPTELALIVRDECPDGSRRAAVVRKVFNDEADTIGLEVPMGEAGSHTLTLQVAKVVNGEYVEVFCLPDRKVFVRTPPPQVLAENEGIVLCGIDTPAHVGAGSMKAIVALQRMGEDAPSNLCLIARNVLPDGSKRAAMVRKTMLGTEAQTIGIEVPMGEAGEHWVEFSVAECTDEGNVEIFFIPARLIRVTNPPPPRIQQADAVVLCGVDVCGARWPSMVAEPVCNGTGRVIVAVSRTWEDAPTDFVLTVHDVDNARSAQVKKSIKSSTPETIGLEVPMRNVGTLKLMVRISAQYADGSVRQLFELPVVEVEVRQHTALPPVVLAENEGIVLCGIDTPAYVGAGSMKAIVALQRMGEDAPSNLCLIARNVLPDGSKRAAMVRKTMLGTEAQTIGIEVPMGEAGEHWVEFSVAECTDEGNVEIFFIPARLIRVTNSYADDSSKAYEPFSEPELIEVLTEEEDEEAELVSAPVVKEETVCFKVGFLPGAASEASVIRRLPVVLGVDDKGRHVEAFHTINQAIMRAFVTELDPSIKPSLCYTDECGAELPVMSDLDVAAALRAPRKASVVRLALRQ